MSNSVQPQRWQPTRLPRPWDSPGKKLEWAAISFSSAWKWKVKVKLLSHVQLFVTPWTTRLSVHGVFQARVLEWGTIASSDKGILLKHKKEQNNVIFSNMNTIRDYHIKWSKSERERQTSYIDITYVEIETDIGNRLVAAVGQGVGEIDRYRLLDFNVFEYRGNLYFSVLVSSLHHI